MADCLTAGFLSGRLGAALGGTGARCKGRLYSCTGVLFSDVLASPPRLDEGQTLPPLLAHNRRAGPSIVGQSRPLSQHERCKRSKCAC